MKNKKKQAMCWCRQQVYAEGKCYWHYTMEVILEGPVLPTWKKVSAYMTTKTATELILHYRERIAELKAFWYANRDQLPAGMGNRIWAKIDNMYYRINKLNQRFLFTNRL